MLDKLKKMVEHGQILDMLYDEKVEWQSMVIDRRKPVTYRIYTYIDDMRLCLHQFSQCSAHEAFYHPHPWPGAFYILGGSYNMGIGISKDQYSKPSHVANFVMSAGSSYEILDPLVWHSVVPNETTCTVMLNGPPFENPHQDTVTTKGKNLPPMADREFNIAKRVFACLLGGVFR